MDRHIGEIVKNHKLLSVLGDEVFIPNNNDKIILLTLFRFATCPFCNLRLRELESFKGEHPNIEIIGIFGSPIDQVKKSIEIHNLTFSLISDLNGDLYREFGIKKSLWGVVKGITTRIPTILKAMSTYHVSLKSTDGHLLTMPAEFLISPKGKILYTHYGKDEGDHANLEEILNAIKN